MKIKMRAHATKKQEDAIVGHPQLTKNKEPQENRYRAPIEDLKFQQVDLPLDATRDRIE